MGTIKMDKTLEQGIFVSESEMSLKEETKFSIYNKSTTIAFEEKDSRKSKLKTVIDYLALQLKEIKKNTVPHCMYQAF